MNASFLGCCWRAVRRLVFALLTLVALAAVFYVFENWRGRRAWEQCKTELRARGERLGLADYAVAPVPAAENFAETPVLRAIAYHATLDTNVFARFQAVKGVQSFYPMGEGVVGKENAAQVLAAFQGVEAEMAELRAAARRPYAQFTKNNTNVFLADVPSFVVLRTLSQLFIIHAQAELALGHHEAALADTTVVRRIADSLGGQSSLVEAMIRSAILGITLQTFEQGRADGAWSDAELLAWQKSFESVDLLPGLDVALRGGERNSITGLVEDAPRLTLTEMQRGFQASDLKGQAILQVVRWCPRGWLLQNNARYTRVMQKSFDGYDVRAGRVFPEKCADAVTFVDAQASRGGPFNFLIGIGVPNISKAVQSTARVQTWFQEAALACALERYRRAHGEYPATLAALVPQFTAKLPADLMSGGGLKYQRPEPDKFLLYSVGWNLQDDGGTRAKDLAAGDWLWPPAR